MDLSPPRLKTLPVWTPWRDPLAEGDAAVRRRMRFLFTPLPSPTLSTAGARAGLGPDGPTRGERAANDAVTTVRPDPRLDRPIASRLPDADIGEAKQMAQAERLGVHVPLETPMLSPKGKNAGLGAFSPRSSSPKAVAAASLKDLAMSRSKVAVAARKTTMMDSRPVAPMSEASARVGITGNEPIPAKDRGFEMRVPKGPVAQDRERWASGTQDRIAAASKGLSLSNMDWGDHRGAPSKPEPKRTWVAVQGDATECRGNCLAACSDLALAPYAAVNKTAPFRELQKERAPSDECPPITSSAETRGLLLRRELLDAWASNRTLSRGVTANTGRFEPGKGGANSANGCGCDDCGCTDRVESKSGAGPAYASTSKYSRDVAAPKQATGIAPAARAAMLRLIGRAARIRGLMRRR